MNQLEVRSMIAWSDEQIDPLAPARGAVWGVLGGLAMWAVVIALVWWWRA